MLAADVEELHEHADELDHVHTPYIAQSHEHTEHVQGVKQGEYSQSAHAMPWSATSSWHQLSQAVHTGKKSVAGSAHLETSKGTTRLRTPADVAQKVAKTRVQKAEKPTLDQGCEKM